MKDLLIQYHQKIKELQTYRFVGISAKQIATVLHNTDLRNAIIRKIQDLLEFDKKNIELKSIKNNFKISYKNNTLWDKLRKRKKEQVITLNGSTEEILKNFGTIGEQIVKREIASLEYHMSDFRIQIKKERMHQKREKEHHFLHPHYQEPLIFEKKGRKILNPNQVCLVHVTRYFPKKNKTGQYEIETLATATNLSYPRNTIHFALNHHVHSHLAGAWDDAPYVILAPLSETSALNNRNPVGVAVTDTFYEMDLNENLKLPKETYLIYPANKNEKWRENQLWKIGTHHAIYKTSNFTKEERELLLSSQQISPQTKITDALLAGLNKENLTHSILKQKGYTNDLLGDNEKNACAQMGYEMGSIADSGNALHSMTLFGVNGIGDYHSGKDIFTIGRISQFLHFAIMPNCKFKLDNSYYKLTTQEDVLIADFQLERLYSKGANLLSEAHQFWQEKTEFIKKHNPACLLTERTLHVFEAWKEKQGKIWAKDLPKFFEKYPTIEAFEKAAQNPQTTSALAAASKKSRL